MINSVNNSITMQDLLLVLITLILLVALIFIPCPINRNKKPIFSTFIKGAGGWGYFGGSFFKLKIYDDSIVTGVFFAPIRIYYKDIKEIYIDKSFILRKPKIVIKSSNPTLYIYSGRKKLEKIIEIINQQKNKS